MKTVFVSSTFRDMQSERDAIREITAPLLNAEARAYGDEIDFCDLRWGINTAQLETDAGFRKVLEVCLDEIDRCKPPMIVLLGYRYGWIPDKSLIEDVATRKNRQLESKSLQKMQLEDLEMSVTALEIEYGSLRDIECFSNTLFYFREIEGDAPVDYQSEDKEHAAKIKALKDRIRAIGGEKIKTYILRWNGSGFDGVDDFARTLANDIKTMLQPQWELYKNLTIFERERCIHQTFVEEKAAIFRARQVDAEKLYSGINDDPVTIIKGEVGSGKSTLFCHLVQRFQEKSDWVVLPFISGLTSSSNDAYDIIKNIVYFIEEKLHIDHYKGETDQTCQSVIHSIDEWRDRLAEMCAGYTADGRKLLIMLDAADQLTQSEARDSLFFIPMNTGKNIHFAMTCTQDFKTLGRDFYTLKPIDNIGKLDVISGTLSRTGRELSKPVVEKMISLKSSGNPLYLSLLVQRLLMMNSADFADIRSRGDGISAIESHQIELITKNCPDNLDEMSSALLTEAGNRINPDLVSKAGQLLAVSRAGLRSHDLSVMLGEDWTEIDFAHFISYMNDCFMQRDDGRFDFSHKSIRTGFLKLCSDVDRINRQILTYFKNLPDDDPVRVSEIIYHAIKGDDKDFFVNYIIIHYNEENTYMILQTALDTYEKCMSDGGEWFVSVLHWAENFLIKSEYGLLSCFVSFKLFDFFKGSQQELEILLFILRENIAFTEKLNTVSNNEKVMSSLYVSYYRIADIFEQINGNVNLESAFKYFIKCLEISKQLTAVSGVEKDYVYLLSSYDRIGGIYEILGGRKNIEHALEMYNKLLEISEQLAAEQSTTDRKRHLSLSYNKIANIYRQLDGQENILCALQLYIKAISISEELVNELQTAELRRELSINYSMIADIYAELGGLQNLKCAFTLYNKVIEIHEQLAVELGTVQSRNDLAVSYERLARMYFMLGGTHNLKSAFILYKKYLSISKQLFEELGTAKSKMALSIGYENVGGIYERFGSQRDLEQALELYKKDLELSKELAKELDTDESKIELSTSYERVAGIYLKLEGNENLKRALKLYNIAIELRKKLAAKMNLAFIRRNLAINYARVANIYFLFGGQENITKSLNLYDKTIKLQKQLVTELDTAQSRRDLSVSYNRLAVLYEMLGGNANLGHALELYKNDLELCEKLAEELSTIDAYDDLAVSLFRIAMHEMTPMNKKRCC